MQWIEEHRKTLWLVEAVGVLAAVATFGVLRSKGVVHVQPWQLGLIVLPWLGIFVAGMPLLYLSWFRDSSSVVRTAVLKVSFGF
jgi:hypothetical protein